MGPDEKQGRNNRSRLPENTPITVRAGSLRRRERNLRFVRDPASLRIQSARAVCTWERPAQVLAGGQGPSVVRSDCWDLIARDQGGSV